MSSPAVVNSVSGSFFVWFQNDVLPYFIGSLYIIVVILELCINCSLIITLKRRKLLKVRSNWFMFQLILVDFISCIFFLGPSIWVAFIQKWQLTEYACKVHGILFTSCYLLTFWLLIAMSVERALKSTNSEKHEQTFLNSKRVLLMSLFFWLGAVCISAIPISGLVNIDYDFYHAACVPFLYDNIYYLSILFILGIVSCFFTYIVVYIIILKSKQKKVKHFNKQETLNKVEQVCIKPIDAKKDITATDENVNDTASETESERKTESKETGKFEAENDNGETSFAEVKEEEFNIEKDNTGKRCDEIPSISISRCNSQNTNDEIDQILTPSTVKVGWQPGNDSRRKSTVLMVRDKMKKVVTQVKVSKMLLNDDSDPDLHLAVTYLIVACLMLFLWLPYFTLNFVAFTRKSVWGGYFSLTLIIAMASYCLKPIVYLAHNRHYREITMETLPDNAVRKASKVRNSIVEALNKVDKVVFKSLSTKRKLSTTIKTITVAKGWLKRSRKNQDENNEKGGDTPTNEIQMLTLDNIDEEKHDQISDETEVANIKETSLDSVDKTGMEDNIKTDDKDKTVVHLSVIHTNGGSTGNTSETDGFDVKENDPSSLSNE